MIPLLLLIIIIAYRKINVKNLDNEAVEQEIFAAELQRERKRLRQQSESLIYDEGRKKECEAVEKYLDEAMEKINFAKVEIQSASGAEKGVGIGRGDLKAKEIDVIVVSDGGGESTDDELFELPLPPLPATPLSQLDNDAISATSSSPHSKFQYDTPKIVNQAENQFDFPPEPTSLPPPLPQNVTSDSEQKTKDVKMRRNKFDLTSLPPLPPRTRKSSSSSSTSPTSPTSSTFPTYSSPTSPMAPTNENRKSSQPVIIETIPKSLLQSDF